MSCAPLKGRPDGKLPRTTEHLVDGFCGMGVGGLLAAWELDPVPSAGVGAAALAYAGAWWRLARDRPATHWPTARPVCFGAGLVALLVALDGPPDALAEQSFSMHMVQHLLITMVAAPLLVVAAPMTLLLRADPKWLPRRALAPVVRSRVARFAAHPMIAFGLLGTVLVLSHLSGFYEAALESAALHKAEHVAYLASAALFWSTTIGVDPVGRRLAAPTRMFLLLLMMPVMALLGLAITQADELLYPFYAANPPPWGATPLADQHLAGTLMWTVGMITMPVPLVVLLWRWFDEDERTHARLSAGQRWRDAAS